MTTKIKTKPVSENNKNIIKSAPKSVSPFKAKKALVLAALFAVVGLTIVSFSFAAKTPPPVLSSPVENATISSSKPTFTWLPVKGTSQFGIQVARASDPTFSKPVLWRKVEGTSLVSPKTLANGKYLWRVRSRSLNIPGPWSAARTINIGSIVVNPPPPTTPPPPPPTTPPLTGLVKAFDRANSVDDPAWFKKMYNRGFRLYILHTTWWEDTKPGMTPKCQPWPGAIDHIKWALDAGIKVAAYTRDPRCWKGGIEAAGPYKDQLQFFDIDVETDPGVKVTREMIDGIKAMGVKPLIYSGAGMWPEVMGSNTAFSDVALYDTNVTGKVTIDNWVPSLDSPKPIPYGGWNTATNKRVALQQAFDVMVDGYSVDLNTFDASFLK